MSWIKWSTLDTQLVRLESVTYDHNKIVIVNIRIKACACTSKINYAKLQSVVQKAKSILLMLQSILPKTTYKDDYTNVQYNYNVIIVHTVMSSVTINFIK